VLLGMRVINSFIVVAFRAAGASACTRRSFGEAEFFEPGPCGPRDRTRPRQLNELITLMPNNTGWYLPRAQFTAYLRAFAEISDTLIITGHVKPKSIEDNVREADLGDMDLIGKNSRLLAGAFQS